MKPPPPPPQLNRLSSIDPDRRDQLWQRTASIRDDAYLHWDKLRHLRPPDDLTTEEWWLALKLKRRANAILVPQLRATNGTALQISRHPRIDAALAEADRRLAGSVAAPQPILDKETRERFVASSLMEEAIHSSLFEGAVSTREAAKDLLRSARAPINRDERMIVNNFRAMERLRELRQRALTVEDVLELHRIITDGTLDDPDCAGRIQTPAERRVEVYDRRINRTVHTPPSADQLPQRLQRLVEFANAPDTEDGVFLHPVLRSILLHFQLAYDHPFADGNGRTARALFYWSMLRHGFWLTEFLSISRLLHVNRAPYERAYQLVESDEQDGTYFVLQQLDALDEATTALYSYVARKTADLQAFAKLLRQRNELNNRQIALLHHALRKPGTAYTHESHANSHRVSIVSARADLLGLVALGFLKKSRHGRRFLYAPTPNLGKIIKAR
jgi:Fic family protein